MRGAEHGGTAMRGASLGRCSLFLAGSRLALSVYYFFFEKSRSLLLASKSRALAAANSGKGASAGAVILAGGALTTAESMLAGLIAGCATSIISNPIWVINTRQTVRAPASAAAGKAGAAKSGAQGKKDVKMGFFQTLSHIVHKDGVLALWRGIGPALVLVINPILQVSGARGGARWGKRGEGKRR